MGGRRELGRRFVAPASPWRPRARSTAQSHTYADGPNDYTVTVTVTDKDGDSDSETFSVHVNNVAPTATLANNGPVNEGSPATVSFSNQFDPSVDRHDRRVPLRLRLHERCPADDLRGGRQLVLDDLHVRRQRQLHRVGPDLRQGRRLQHATRRPSWSNNVAPTATLANNGPVNEGSPATVSFSNQFDPSLDRHDGRFPLRLQLLERLPADDLHGSRHDHEHEHDLHVRRQRQLHGVGPDLRQGQRLQQLHDDRRGEQRRPDGDPGQQRPGERGEPGDGLLLEPVRSVVDRHDRRVPLRLRLHERCPADDLRGGRQLVLDDLHVRRQRQLHRVGPDLRQGRRLQRPTRRPSW